MTTVSDIEGEIDEVGEDVLSDLGPGERTALAIRLAAIGDRERLDQLESTAPTRTYEVTGAQYKERVRDAVLMAALALRDLETGMMEYLCNIEAEGVEDEPSIASAVRFLGTYRAWDRYSREDVGVDLTELLLCVSGGEGVAPVTGITLAAKAALCEISDESDDDEPTASYGGDRLTVDQLTDRKYAALSDDGAGGLLTQ